MLETAVSILVALLVFCVIVFVHELGHYAAGRFFGFRILDFSIGMGPVLFQKERKGIKYSLRALPLGGACLFYGEDAAVGSGGFNSHPPWKRILVIAAGPVMNVIFALFLAAASLMAYGEYVAAVDSFIPERPLAQEAGMQAGDILYAVDGKRVEFYSQATERIQAGDPERAVVTVRRDGELVDIPVNGLYDEAAGRNYLGINIVPVRYHYGVFAAIAGSFRFVGSVISEMLAFLGGIFTHGVQQGDVAGPVGTIAVIGQAVRMGFEMVLYIGILIGVNLAIINLLPFPALDGGRLVFLFLEWIRGKAIPPEKEGLVHFVGIVLLLGLAVVLTYNDIVTLLGGTP